ncbi:MAG: YraN family protein [Actinomycetota bacterium]|nr:YraN family protein [Actinomycetota bacterium]
MHADTSPPALSRADPSSAPPTADGAGAVDRRRALGRLGEELAAGHLQRLGFSIVARNVRTRHGEIDLIAFGGQTLVFCEVKTRRVSPGQGGVRPDQRPLAALGPRQRARLRRLAAAWLREGGQARPAARTIRFDAVGVMLDGRGSLVQLDHIEGAW